MIHNQAAFGGDCSPLSVRIIKSVDDCLHEFKKAIVSGNYVTRQISKSHQIKKFTKTAETRPVDSTYRTTATEHYQNHLFHSPH